MQLSETDMGELTAWRRELHRHPELSGEEERTAATVIDMLRATGPDEIVSGLGGHGVAAIYDSGRPGPRVLLRCELDGLPIEDTGPVSHRSTVSGKGHQCGHDGHMAILAAMARLLGRRRPPRGSAVLMFQPAEENGSGARKVVGDPRFQSIGADFAFAIHNMPGIPFGRVELAEGPVCCASRGMKIRLTGRTAHASQPETGVSPMRALARLMEELTDMRSPPGIATRDPAFTLVTVTHATMGAPAFGVAPGAAEIFATLRTLTDDRMDDLVRRAQSCAGNAAREHGLGLEITYEDVFVTCENDAEAVAIARSALDAIGLPYGPGILPMRASEDFGYFGTRSKSALLLLGAGEDVPALHNPDYDFPDALIPIGSAIFDAVLRQLLEDRAA